MPRRTSTLSRSHKRESQAETEARHAFNAAVWAKAERIRGNGCVLADHECVNTIVDCHHVLRKQTLRRRFMHLPELELLAIVWDPRNGTPCCRLHHDRLSVASVRLTRAHLTDRFPEVFEFAADYDLTHLLERELAPK